MNTSNANLSLARSYRQNANVRQRAVKKATLNVLAEKPSNLVAKLSERIFGNVPSTVHSTLVDDLGR